MLIFFNVRFNLTLELCYSSMTSLNCLCVTSIYFVKREKNKMDLRFVQNRIDSAILQYLRASKRSYVCMYACVPIYTLRGKLSTRRHFFGYLLTLRTNFQETFREYSQYWHAQNVYRFHCSVHHKQCYAISYKITVNEVC